MTKPSNNKSIAISLDIDPETRQFMNLYFKDKEMVELLNRRDQQVSYEVVSSRTLSHWEGCGLLTVEREKGEWRRKFSLMDMLWLYIMSQLRNDYEISLDKLLLIKESLEDQKDKYGVPMPVLEVFTALALTKRKDVVLIIFPDCSAKPFLFKYARELLRDFDKASFIVINLNKILELVLPKYQWVKENI